MLDSKIIWWKSIYYAICWIAIYPVDSAIKHFLHEWPLGKLFMGVAQDLLVVSSFKYWLHSTDCLLPLNAKMLHAIAKVLTISWSGFPIPRAWVCLSMSLLLSQHFPKPPWPLEHLCCKFRIIFYTCIT